MSLYPSIPCGLQKKKQVTKNNKTTISNIILLYKSVGLDLKKSNVPTNTPFQSQVSTYFFLMEVVILPFERGWFHERGRIILPF